MRESAEDESGLIAKLEAELDAVRKILVQSLAQIDKMYIEIDALKEENLMLRYTVMHNAVISNEIRGMLEDKD
jgi:hypothetical protein